MYTTARSIANMALRNSIICLSVAYRSMLGLLHVVEQSALVELVEPARCISLRHLVVDAIVLGKEVCNGIYVERFTLKGIPQIECTLVERDDACEVAERGTLHNHNVLSSHLTNFVLLFNLHLLTIITPQS